MKTVDARSIFTKHQGDQQWDTNDNVPGTVLGTRAPAVNEANRKVCLRGAYTGWNKIKIITKKFTHMLICARHFSRMAHLTLCCGYHCSCSFYTKEDPKAQRG